MRATELRGTELAAREDKPSLPQPECAPLQVPAGSSKAGQRPVTACRPRWRRIGKAVSSGARIRGHRERHSRIHSLMSRLATIAAPNPLSMFMTVTLDAQLFNMLSSAVNPPKLDP